MKKKLLSLLVVSILSIGIIGCGENSTTIYNNKIETDNFIVISEDILNANDSIITIEDKNTGKRYIIYKGYQKGGIVSIN